MHVTRYGTTYIISHATAGVILSRHAATLAFVYESSGVAPFILMKSRVKESFASSTDPSFLKKSKTPKGKLKPTVGDGDTKYEIPSREAVFGTVFRAEGTSPKEVADAIHSAIIDVTSAHDLPAALDHLMDECLALSSEILSKHEKMASAIPAGGIVAPITYLSSQQSGGGTDLLSGILSGGPNSSSDE